MATQNLSERQRPTVIDRSERRGSVRLVVLVAVVLVATASVLMFVDRNHAEPYILTLLAVLGMVGVFSLFAVAAGILRVADKDAGNPLIKAVVERAADGMERAALIAERDAALIEVESLRRLQHLPGS